MIKFNSIQEIERLLDLHLDFKKNDLGSNYLQKAVPSKSFDEDFLAANAQGFVLYAEYSYGIARLLFQLRITWYAHFCAQQAVENYLKAYLKSKGVEPKLTHSLEKLLKACRAVESANAFIGGARIEAVLLKFDAFNEVARYPVQRVGPEYPAVASVHPDDMYILDYFVFQVRKEIPDQPGVASLFTSGHVHLNVFRDRLPQIYSLIADENINFGG